MESPVSPKLVEMLRQASELDTEFRTALIQMDRQVPPAARAITAYGYCRIALEHCAGSGTLLRDENPTAALALVRLQFEAVLRGSWVFYAASDEWVGRFSAPVPDNNGREPMAFPLVHKLVAEMLDSSRTPEVLHTSLDALKSLAWDSLNSYTHGGLRQITRVLNGYEEELIAWMIRTTNTLLYIACQLCAHVMVDPSCSFRLSQIRASYPSCMHPVPGE